MKTYAMVIFWTGIYVCIYLGQKYHKQMWNLIHSFRIFRIWYGLALNFM